MLAPFPDWNPELLERHAETLDLLWMQRAGAWRGSGFTPGTLARHDARIAAHADALVIAGDSAWWLAEPRLLGEDASAATGAAHVLLLREDPDGAARARAALEGAAGLALDAFAVALRHAPLAPHREEVERLARGRAEGPAAAALAALAFHGEEAGLGRLVDLVQSAEAPVRSRAWNAVGSLGEKLWASQLSGVRTALDQAFPAGVVDPDVAVRTEALEAAAWTRQPWLLAHLREQAAGPESLPALRLLATLGGAEDLPALRAAAANPKLGPSRMALLGALGHPGGVPDLLAALTSFEPPVAAAAALAFRAVTGIAVDGPRRLPARPWDRDEEEDVLGETFPVPDVPKARSAWADLATRIGAAGRLAGGIDVTAGVAAEAWARLDLESTWALRLRDAFTRRAPCRRAELEALRA